MKRNREEQWVLSALAFVLGQEEKMGSLQAGDDLDRSRILTLLQKHAVTPLLYPIVETGLTAEPISAFIREISIRTVQQSYRLMFLTHYLVEKLEQAGVSVVVLKGVSVAEAYPVPELRKSGDVDLFLPLQEQLETAVQVFDGMGFQRERKQRVNHHHVWRTPDNIEVELHVMFAEPFDDTSMNQYMEQLAGQVPQEIRYRNVMGLDFPVLSDGYQAYQLLLHMLQHFLRSGFGLKLLCDWVVFWNWKISEETLLQYHTLLAESGLEGFSDMVTSLCGQYLGLREDVAKRLCGDRDYKEDYDEFLRDILEAAEFGGGDPARMVALRGTGMRDYVREFHHQMKLANPKMSRYRILWPVLWIKTGVRFWQNNKQIRGISTGTILKKAGQRSRNIEKLRLFQRKL